MNSAAFRIRFLAPLALLALVPSALAKTYTVMQDGTGDALTITGGVALATDGDSVLVGPGTYFEEVAIGVSMTLLSRDGADYTTIDADSGKGGSNRCIYSSEALNELVVHGFQLTGATLGYGFGNASAVAGFGDLSMSDCKLYDNDHGLAWIGDARLERCEAWDMTGWLATPFAVEGEASVTECFFHDMGGGVVAAFGSPLLVENCVFRDIVDSGSFPFAVSVIGPVTVLDCVFQDLEIGGVGPYAPRVTSRASGPLVSCPTTVIGCTFSRVDGGAIWGGSIDGACPFFGVGVVVGGGARTGDQIRGVDPFVVIQEFSTNLVSGGLFGVRQCGLAEVPGLYSCNNVWANGTNWQGLPDPTGQDGNIAEPPLFCDASGGNLTVALNSPCLPQNNSCGVLIGALPQGCGPLSIQTESWGVIKSKYR